MAEVVEIIPEPGGRTIVFDDGTRIHELEPVVITGDPGPGPEDRGIGDRLALGSDPGAMGRRSVRGDNPEDIAWLRFEIEHGNFTRESAPIRVDAHDMFAGICEHEGWYYTVGLRSGITVAQRVTGHLGPATPMLDPATYLWGVRGSEAARAAWARDRARSSPGPSLPLSPETSAILADRGLPPDVAITDRSLGEMSWSDIPAAMLLISQAALHAQESFRRWADQFVARYNHERYGSLVAVLVGIVEFAFRLVTDVIGLPAAIAELFEGLSTTFGAIRAAVPDIITGLNEAPLETVAVVAHAVYDATLAVTGLGDIGTEISTGVEMAGDGRTAESSLHLMRALGRILDLIMIVHALVSVVRRLPGMVRSMRTAVTSLTESARSLRTLRTALREGRSLAAGSEELAEGTRGARTRGAPGETPVGDAPGGERPRTEAGAPEGERPATDTPDGEGAGGAPEGERAASDSPDGEGGGGTPVEEAPAEGATPTEEHPGLDESFREDPDAPEGNPRLPRSPSTPGTRALAREGRALRAVRARLTAAQLRAAQRFVGRRLNSVLRRAWRSVINDLDRRDLAEIRELMRRAESPSASVAVRQALREAAYEIAREYLYPRVAGRFWNHIRRTPRLAHIFEEAGLTLRPDRVPAWLLPGGREARLSLEHAMRVSDNPLLCIDPENLMIVPLAENSYMLEAIRAIERSIELAAAGGG